MLHVVRDWAKPSEGFVADVIGTTTATVPFVAFGAPGPGRTADVPAHDLSRFTERGAKQVRMALAAVTLARRVDLLHAHFGYWASHTAAVARRTRKPWVVSLHGHDLLVEGVPDLLDADLVTVPSHYLADAASRAGVPDERLRVIPSGIDLARHPFRERHPHDGPVLVTFAGRYVEKKGVLDVAHALAGIEGIRCRFVGHGPMEQELRDLLTELDVDAELLDGSVTGAVQQAIQETDLLVTASKVADNGDAETLGLVNLEAQASGVPVVTTRSGGIPEAVSPDGAILVPESDVRALRAAVSELVAHPDRWAAMGRAGRQHVALRYELGSRVADLEEQWRALAAKRPLPPVAPLREALPKVSVVLVTNGRRALVDRALDALSAQTYPADLTEVVVVDNASTDGTAEDLATRAVTVLREQAHSPVAAARNRAIGVATGEVIAFTDDDCRPTPTWLEGLVAGLRADTALVQGRTVADPSQPLLPLSRTQWVPAEAGLYETSNVAYTARSLADAHGFDESFAGDVERVLGRHFGRYPFGEDTDLAWRVKRAGGTSRFAAHAVVQHHVFDPDPSYLLRRSVVGGAWPLLVRRVPELDQLLIGRVVLGAQRGRVLLAIAGVVAAPFTWWALLATAPWLYRAVGPLRRGRLARIRAIPVLALRDVVETGSLAYGSVRARRLVL
ncbi:MAG: glycosyl transferase family 2 [Frankiales bacterium]|nr:glycosyl transferase family 2 [Frankiales bacterium]